MGIRTWAKTKKTFLAEIDGIQVEITVNAEFCSPDDTRSDYIDLELGSIVAWRNVKETVEVKARTGIAS